MASNLECSNQEMKKALKSLFETEEGRALWFVEMLYDIKDLLLGVSQS